MDGWERNMIDGERLDSSVAVRSNWNSDKLLFTFAEVSRLADISESMVRKMVKLGKLEAVKIGRARRVPRQALLELCGAADHAEVKS